MYPSPYQVYQCRACGSDELADLFSLGDQYVSDFVPEGRERDGPHCPIELCICQNCTLVQQRWTAQQDFMYTRHYWYRSGVTETMRAALEDVVVQASVSVQLHRDDVVLDIGSNDGTLLRHWNWVRPGLTTVGFEPASNLAAEGRQGIDCFINEFWTAHGYRRALGNRKAKVITACGMMYDLDDPLRFVSDVAECLADDGVFVAQLQCLKQTVALADVGNFCHEHLEFYSLHSLDLLYRAAGLEIFDVTENAVNGGSYRVFAKKAGAARLPGETQEAGHRFYKAVRTEAVMRLSCENTYHALYSRMCHTRDECVRYVRKAAGDGKAVWVYGASTKGNTILQFYGLGPDVICGAADRSPEKIGKVTAGTGIKIYGEDEARAARPDYFLVLPYAFIDEFVAREANQDWRAKGGKFLVPLPEFRVL